MCILGGLLFMWGVVPNFVFSPSVAASQKNMILALQKWKRHFLWDETKIRLRGVPRHPKGYARVWYGLVLADYAMIRAKPSLFDLKATQFQTWRSFSVKGIFVKLLWLRFKVFPTSRWHKMTRREGLTFFRLFQLVTPNSGPAWNDNARQLPFVARRCGVLL
jgi:hypothetical protein